MGWDKYWYRQKISEKIFQPLSIPHSRVPFKHAKCGDSRFKWAASRKEGEEEEVRGQRTECSGSFSDQQ
jgi:hypothetical protein